MPTLPGIGAILGNYQIVTQDIQDPTRIKEKYSANPGCVRCNGTGWVYIYPGNYKEIEHCTAKGCMAESYEKWRKNPERMQSHGVVQVQSFDNFVLSPKNKPAYKAAKSLAYGEAPFIWLLIYGGTGNGKTHLCYAITKTLIERGLTAKMIASAELFAEIRKGIETKEDVMKHYKDIPALIIDDWGVGYGTEFEKARFDELLAYRYEHYMVTVLTTNKDLPNLPERVRSRFEDKLKSLIIFNEAGDYRKVAR